MTFLDIANLTPNSLNSIVIETIPIKTHDNRKAEIREILAPFSSKYLPIGYPDATGPIITTPVNSPKIIPLNP